MINVSKAFRRNLYEGNNKFLIRLVITLQDDTELEVKNDNIMSNNGILIDDAVSEDDDFTALGSTIINACDVILYNNTNLYSDYEFINAKVVVYIGLQIEENVEEFKKGTYTVDDAIYGDSTISLSLVDEMAQFDKPYNESQLRYPATLNDIILNACSICNVPLATNSLQFPHRDFLVAEKPNEESTTFREIIGWTATIAGCFARCNVDGELELAWFNINALDNEQETSYDGGTFNPWSEGNTVDGGTFNPWSTGNTVDSGNFTDVHNVHYISSLYSQSLGVDDVVITGVRITVEIEDTESDEDIKEFIQGTDNYLIDISDNKFITADNAPTVLNWLATLLIGTRFRKCDIQHLTDPTIEAGDVALLWDTKGLEHRILVTRVDFSPTSLQTVISGAASVGRNSAIRFSNQTKSYVATRRQLRKQQDSYDQALEQLEEKVDNANGLYKTEVEQQGGSTIIYYHNKPELEESDIRIIISDVGITVTANGTDEHPTWYGLEVNGELIASILNTVGVNADWIRTGSIQDKVGYNYWNLVTGEFRLSPNTTVGQDTLDDFANKSNVIIEVTVEYAVGDSSTTAPTSGWSSNTPTWQVNKYIWQRTKTVDGNNQSSYSNPTCIQGAKGEDGTSVNILGSYNSYAELIAAHPTGSIGDAYIVSGDLYIWDGTQWLNAGSIQGPQGIPGQDGVGISSVVIKYGTSNSASTQPTNWNTTAPTNLVKGTWLWIQTVTTYSDNRSNTVYQKSYIGTDGNDGTSVFIRSATKVDGVTTVIIEDTKGHTNTLTIDDGTDGINGTPGTNGLNGYVHIAWATSADGSEGFSTTVSSGKTYLGTYTDNTQADSQDYRAYSWSLIKGANGTDGDDGIGISSIVEQYYLSTSNTTQSGGEWSTNQPLWESGKYIWTRSHIIWTDNSVTNTEPVLAQAINGANQAVAALNNSLTQQEIFNRLTNNGQAQGIFLEADGKLYVNAEYLVTGRISDVTNSSYWDLTTGEMNLVGTLTIKIDKVFFAAGSIDYKSISISTTTGTATISTLTKNGIQAQYINADSPLSKIALIPYHAGTVSYAAPDSGFTGNTFTPRRVVQSVSSGITYAVDEVLTNYYALNVADVTNSSVVGYFQLKATEIRLSAGKGKNINIQIYANYINITSGTGTTNATVNCSSSGFTIIGGGKSLTATSSGTYVSWGGRNLAYVSSSSKRYKKEIEELKDENLNPHKLYNLQPKQFKYNKDAPLQYQDMEDKLIPGFIAEEVAEIYPAAVIYDDDKRIESWDERRIIPGMLSLIQEQKQKIDELEERIARLEKLLLKEE